MCFFFHFCRAPPFSIPFTYRLPSISAQVIQRGTRSAGYGFVSFSSLEAAEKAVTALNKKELDGRTIIVEIAKPTEQKDKEKSEKRAKRRVGRRGAKAPHGEVTEAEANGDSDKPEGAAVPASSTGATKPRKKRQFVGYLFAFCHCFYNYMLFLFLFSLFRGSTQGRLLRIPRQAKMPRAPMRQTTTEMHLLPRKRLVSLVNVLPVLQMSPRSVNHPRRFSLLPT